MKAERRLDEAIRTTRAKRGWTQSHLAARIGTTPATVSRWERGRARPRWRRLRALAQALELPASELGRARVGEARGAEPQPTPVASRIARALDELVGAG